MAEGVRAAIKLALGAAIKLATKEEVNKAADDQMIETKTTLKVVQAQSLTDIKELQDGWKMEQRDCGNMKTMLSLLQSYYHTWLHRYILWVTMELKRGSIDQIHMVEPCVQERI